MTVAMLATTSSSCVLAATCSNAIPKLLSFARPGSPYSLAPIKYPRRLMYTRPIDTAAGRRWTVHRMKAIHRDFRISILGNSCSLLKT
ncbi:hypothetical protein QBC43DRAFT_325403 [Cladorrhinum sp. PSN259]|nr:hypothetical protein QBC43DRAFT_325403 [Cladorrhinum sp. PSN259]